VLGYFFLSISISIVATTTVTIKNVTITNVFLKGGSVCFGGCVLPDCPFVGIGEVLGVLVGELPELAGVFGVDPDDAGGFVDGDSDGVAVGVGVGAVGDPKI